MNLRACIATAGVALLVLAGCGERPPIDSVQLGYRGLGMEQNINPRLLEAARERNGVPAVTPPASPEGPRASEVYRNVQVLGDLSVGEFTRVMLAMTSWVAPAEQACNYCHGADMADDSKYTYRVSRTMLQMTRHVNSEWQSHVGATGVTCYTCHRGQQVPQYAWFTAPVAAPRKIGGAMAQQNSPQLSVAQSSLPYDPFTPFLAGDTEIRVIGDQALPHGNRRSIKQTEWTYGLMMHMSESLGVNCTYCHNTRAFKSWDGSPPARTTAWYGIRMTRDLNNAYLTPITSTFPANRLGPTGDVAKVNCSTCHQGVYKPFFGAGMVKDYPELSGVRPPPAPPAPAEGAPAVDGAGATGTTPAAAPAAAQAPPRTPQPPRLAAVGR